MDDWANGRSKQRHIARPTPRLRAFLERDAVTRRAQASSACAWRSIHGTPARIVLVLRYDKLALLPARAITPRVGDSSFPYAPMRRRLREMTMQRSYHARMRHRLTRFRVTLHRSAEILTHMVDDLLHGRVTSFRREQGFGVITLDDGRDVKFDASACTMIPEEGASVRLRIGPARWGGGFKALHVEARGSSRLFVPAPPPSLDLQIAALQREHLVSALSEHVMAQLIGDRGDAALIDVLDAFYAADPARARDDGYLRFAQPASDVLPMIAAALPGLELRPRELRSIDDLIVLVNDALEAAGDHRRLYPLETGHDWHACFLLTTDRAIRLAKALPFT
jgi:cold shock CspA family protein